MKLKERPKAEERTQSDDDIDRLVQWAEVDRNQEQHEESDQEPCESDVMDDRAGLPAGSPGDLEDHLVNEE